MYRFRKLGLIHYNDGMQVKAHFLNIVVHDYNIFVKSIFRTRLRLPTVQLDRACSVQVVPGLLSEISPSEAPDVLRMGWTLLTPSGAFGSEIIPA